MNDFEARRAKLIERADRVSQEIRDAEKMLASTPTVSAKYGVIFWDAPTKRIMLENKPLIEHKLEARIDGHYYLDCLVNRVILETEESLGVK